MASILLVLIQSIGVSYLPTLFSHENKDDNKRYYVKMLTYYTFIITWLIIAFVFFYKIPLWPLVKNKEYWDGLTIVPILCFAFLFQGMTYFVNVGVSLTNKNRYMILPSILIATINILLNIWLLPVFGFMFAAYCVLFSHILSVSTYSFFSYRFYKIKFEWGKNLLTIGLAAAFIFISNLPWANDSVLVRISLRTVMLISFPLILWRLGYFEKIEVETILEKLKDPKSFFRKG
jgi:O-antigen/teichoic acid export membrane protein